ncbi:hypothetical protein AAHE18_01G160300 [Arachis hypogaea]
MTRQGAYKESDDMLIDEPKLPQQGQIAALPNEFNPSYLKIYYSKLFPHADLYRWMSYGNDGKHPACDSSYLGRREFSYTLDNDIFVRYNTFNSATELENSIKDKCPLKIDIGPIYNLNPARRNAYAGDNVLTPVERELIFDIDMSDYDDVRYCCSGADVCLNCWPLMTVAVKVIDTSLRDDFGFRHILWVYSGRRGVHCWVCDRKARRLTNEQRAAVADYFRVYKLLLLNFEESGKKVGGLLVQKKTLILFDGSSLNSCCKNIRHKGCVGVLKRLCSPIHILGLIWRELTAATKESSSAARWSARVGCRV